MSTKQFIIQMLSAGDNVSSKRVTGVLCVLIYILFIVLNFFISLSETQLKLLDGLLWGGVVLLGVSLVEKGINTFKK
jgi:hypothetical protein